MIINTIMGFEDLTPEKLPDNVENRLASLLQIYQTLARTYPHLFPRNGREVQLAVKNTNLRYDGDDLETVIYRVVGHTFNLSSDEDGIMSIREVVKLAETDDSESLIEEGDTRYFSPMDEEIEETVIQVVANQNGHTISCIVNGIVQAPEITQEKVISVIKVLLTYLLDRLDEIHEYEPSSSHEILSGIIEDIQIFLNIHESRDFKVTHVKIEGADMTIEDQVVNIFGTKVSKTFLRNGLRFSVVQKSEFCFAEGFYILPEYSITEVTLPEDTSEIKPNESYNSLQVYFDEDDQLNWMLMRADYLPEEGVRYFEEHNPPSSNKDVLELLLVTAYSSD